MNDCRKFAAVGAVFIMIAVAFAGISFGSEESDGASYTYPVNTTELVRPAAGDVITITGVQSVINARNQNITVDSSTNTATFTVSSLCTPTYSGGNREALLFNDTSGNGCWFSLYSNENWPMAEVKDYYTSDKTLYVVNGTNVSFTATYDDTDDSSYYMDYEKVTSVTSGVGLTLNNGTLSGTVNASVGSTISIVWARHYDFNESGVDDEGGTITLKVVSLETKHDHKITYSGNGNTGGSTANTVVTASGTDAVNVTLASNGYTKTGYTFTGWLVNGTVYQPGATISVAADATVTATAQWSQNTVSATASTLYGKTDASYTHQISASANNGGSITSYAIKSATGVTASVSASGVVTYNCPAVTSTTTYSLTVTVTGTFSDGSTISKDVTFDVLVDPILDFTNAVTDGSLTVKGA